MYVPYHVSSISICRLCFGGFTPLIPLRVKGKIFCFAILTTRVVRAIMKGVKSSRSPKRRADDYCTDSRQGCADWTAESDFKGNRFTIVFN